MVVLEDAPGAVCGRTADRLQLALDAERELFALGLPLPSRSILHDRSDDPEQGRRVVLYELHRRDLYAGLEDGRARAPNTSSVDRQIARRLRATGHAQDDVAAVIEAGCGG